MIDQDIKLRKIKCTRCSRLAEIANTQSRQKDGLVTAYCFNQSHRKLKIRVILNSEVSRTIRSNRMKSTVQYDEDFNMRRLKCVLCGEKLWFDKKGSYQGGGKISGYCYNNDKHRLKINIFAKLMQEPDFDELQEVILHEYEN